MAIRRIYVEKRPGFDVEATRQLSDLRAQLRLDALTAVRCLNRYDVEGLDDEGFALACRIILAEPNADALCEEELTVQPGWTAFAMEYLPGQYDLRADSAMQCARMLGYDPEIRTARVLMLQGALTEEQIQAVQQYCINPVDSRLARMDKPDTLVMEATTPAVIERMEGFCAMNRAAIQALHESMGLAMSVEDLLFAQDYFQNQEKRDPSETEIRVLDTYWSDHCRHTTFHTVLTELTLPDGPYRPAFEQALALYQKTREQTGRADRPITLMDMGTIAARAQKQAGLLDNLDASEEINACSVVMPVTVDGKNENWLLQFKNETHNHPTEIEPFGGAATCLGGAIRDILAGRGYTHQAMRVTGSADPLTPLSETVPGRLPQRLITTGAAAGFSSYGNQIGLATGQVFEVYDPGYVAKRMEVGAVVGAARQSDVVRMTPAPGDKVVLLGGRTGRDGIGGATGSSVSHDANSLADCGAQVQKGNPLTERKIQRLMRNSEAIRLIKRCNDFGAGGVCVAIGELAAGLKINLDVILKKYEGLNGTELAISESQERMAMVIAPENVEAFIAFADAENLEAVVVAEVTESPRLVMHWRGDEIVNIARAFLDSAGVQQYARAVLLPPAGKNPLRTAPEALRALPCKQAFAENMRQLNTASQKGLVERFDSSIGARTVLMPFGGATQMTAEEAMVAKMPVQGETDDATAMAFGFTPALANWSPLHAGAYAVVQSLLKLAAVGADPRQARLSFQEYYESLRDVPEKWGKPAASLLGALGAQMGLSVAAIGGKDSMSGSFQEYHVPPTLISFAIAPTRASHTVSAALKSGQRVFRIALPIDADDLPDYQVLRVMLDRLALLNGDKRILAASVVREGGMAAALTRMCMGNRTGFVFAKEQDADSLFAPRVGDLLLVVRDESDLSGLQAEYIGLTDRSACITVNGVHLPLGELQERYCEKLESVFPTQSSYRPLMADVPLYAPENRRSGQYKAPQPRVVMPIFPGNNCEYDTERAFVKAGAVCEQVVINNLTSAGVQDSIDRLVKAIGNAQILMIPGGFSAGDEPDGSGKFIAVTLRNARIAAAIDRLLYQRDGLALGICNGFQALIKLGLLPQGKIEPIASDAPTLTFNSIGRHISTMARTRVVSTLSPWLALVKPGDEHIIPISHGEGRFVADEKALKTLMDRNQIAFQYVDEQGVPAAVMPDNPNGSTAAIEGICSPDGRILGKMGHSERIGQHIAMNIPGAQNQRLFEAGVLYFR